MKHAFDALLGGLSDNEVDTLELQLRGGHMVVEDGLIWALRVDRAEVVRTLRTRDVNELDFVDHPSIGALDAAAEHVDFGEGDYEIREMQLFRFRHVVAEVDDAAREMTLGDARAVDPYVMMGDELGQLDVERTRRLRHSLIAAIRIRRPLAFVEASSDGELRMAEMLDAIAEALERTPADLATELTGDTLFWRWRVDVPTVEMSPDTRAAVLQFCTSCSHSLGRADNEFDPWRPPDISVVRGLLAWLQRHRRRSHFRGRRRR